MELCDIKYEIDRTFADLGKERAVPQCWKIIRAWRNLCLVNDDEAAELADYMRQKAEE